MSRRAYRSEDLHAVVRSDKSPLGTGSRSDGKQDDGPDDIWNSEGDHEVQSLAGLSDELPDQSARHRKGVKRTNPMDRKSMIWRTPTGMLSSWASRVY